MLSIASVGETVTVSGQAPIVDVTATSSTTQLTNEMLQLSATPRNNVLSILTMAPGVRTFVEVGGGTMMLENPNPRVYGVGGSIWHTLDGVAARTTNQSVSWDYQTMEEVRVQTLGLDAEQPTRGVQMTAVVKSGGNDFHGSGFWSGASKRLEATNVDAELEAIGITSGDRLDTQSDVSGELGGRIIRDRLWFYSAARRRYAAFDVLNTFKPDGSPGQLINKQRIFTNKVSYQATRSNRLIFMNMWEVAPEEKGLNEFIAYEAREFKDNGRTNTKIEWEGVRGNALIANPSIVLNVEPVGTHRRPNLNIWQLKVEKRFPLPRANTATVALNVYNALNANTATGLQNRSGSEFLRPRSILPPRLAEVGISYRF